MPLGALLGTSSPGYRAECSINSEVSKAWVESCDWFELSLLLSIAHWLDHPARVERDISQMSGKLIVEVPDVRDQGTCGQQDSKEWGTNPTELFRKVTERPRTLLGQVERRTSEYPAHLILIDGPISREPKVPYWNYSGSHPEGNSYHLDFDGSELNFTIREKLINYIPVINFISLMKLGRLVRPTPAFLIKQGIEAIKASIDLRDPNPHNFLWTVGGWKLIDGDDLFRNQNPRVAISMLKNRIRAWKRNQLTDMPTGVTQLPLWRSITWQRPRIIAERMPPERIYNFLRVRFGVHKKEKLRYGVE